MEMVWCVVVGLAIGFGLGGGAVWWAFTQWPEKTEAEARLERIASLSEWARAELCSYYRGMDIDVLEVLEGIETLAHGGEVGIELTPALYHESGMPIEVYWRVVPAIRDFIETVGETYGDDDDPKPPGVPVEATD